MTGILNGEPRSFEKIDRPAMVKSEIVAGVIVDKFITVATYRITSQKQWEDLVEDKAVYFYEQAGDMVRMAVFD